MILPLVKHQKTLDIPSWRDTQPDTHWAACKRSLSSAHSLFTLRLLTCGGGDPLRPSGVALLQLREFNVDCINTKQKKYASPYSRIDQSAHSARSLQSLHQPPRRRGSRGKAASTKQRKPRQLQRCAQQDEAADNPITMRKRH